MIEFPAELHKELQKLDPKQLRLFACDCAQHVLPCFEGFRIDDNRPRKAIEIARLFAMEQATEDVLRKAAGGAESAAWEVGDEVWKITSTGGQISQENEAAASAAATAEMCCLDDPSLAVAATVKTAIEVIVIAAVGLEAAEHIWTSHLKAVGSDTLQRYREAEDKERAWQFACVQTYVPNSSG